MAAPSVPAVTMAYVLALNDLLKAGSRHRRDVAGVGFIFWTKEKTEFDPMALVDQPQPEQIQSLLKLSQFADPNSKNMFYMAGVAGNGGQNAPPVLAHRNAKRRHNQYFRLVQRSSASRIFLQANLLNHPSSGNYFRQSIAKESPLRIE